LLLRIGLGTLLILHGYPEVIGGPEVWAQTGQFMNVLGLSMPIFFGFLTGIIKLFGGICLIFGLFYRPALGLLTLLMLLKYITELLHPNFIFSISPSLILLIVFISLGLIGAGHYSLDKRLKIRSNRRHF